MIYPSISTFETAQKWFLRCVRIPWERDPNISCRKLLMVCVCKREGRMRYPHTCLYHSSAEYFRGRNMFDNLSMVYFRLQRQFSLFLWVRTFLMRRSHQYFIETALFLTSEYHVAGGSKLYCVGTNIECRISAASERFSTRRSSSSREKNCTIVCWL